MPGDVEVDVDGVPAQPVDSFVYDGYGSMPIKDAKITIKVDPVNNTGKIEAKWHDENGKWKYKQTVFAPPHHSTGLRVGPDASLPPELEMNDAIATNVYLHGNSTILLPPDFRRREDRDKTQGLRVVPSACLARVP